MSENPLVAPEVDAPTSTRKLLGPVDGLASTREALGRGDFVEGAVGGVSTGLETLGYITDPFGSLLSMGLSFMLDHVEPFPTWLDELAGDPDAIHAFATTWHNISSRVHSNAEEFQQAAVRASADWEGLSVGVYRDTAEDLSFVIDGFSKAITGVAGGVEVSGGIVAGVRALVRDTVAEIVSMCISKAVELLSVVLAPKAIMNIVSKVAELASTIGRFIDDLVSSMGKFGRYLDDLSTELQDLGREVDRLARAWEAAPINSGLPGATKDVVKEGAKHMGQTDDY